MNRPGERREREGRPRFGSATACALSVLVLSAAGVTEVRAQEPAVDQEAVELLRSATDFLSSLNRFSVAYLTTFEDVLDSGHRIDYVLSGSTIVSRPNKLRAERHGDGIDQVFFYNGETVSLHNPSDRVYATVPAPATIEETLRFAYNSLGIGSPMSDIVFRDAFPQMIQGVTLAMVVGKAVINGVMCDHLLFSRPDVDFQMWVADSGPPLPIMYLVTDTTTPELLSVAAVMSDWNLDPSVPESSFTFAPPEGTIEIPFLEAETIGGPDR